MTRPLHGPHQSEAIVYNEILRAARAGERCPSNRALCAILGASSVATPSRIMKRLAAHGQIVVTSYITGREVYVPALGRTIESASPNRSKHPTAAPAIAATLPRPRTVSLVSREPCFRCGVRGDIGCEHTPDWARPSSAGMN